MEKMKFFSVQIPTLRFRCSVNYNLAYVNSTQFGFTVAKLDLCKTGKNLINYK